MVVRMGSRLFFAVAILSILFAVTGAANAACSGTTSIVCTGGPAAHVQYDRADGVPTATAANVYPSTITVPGTFTGTVTAVTVKLNGYVAPFVNPTANG